MADGANGADMKKYDFNILEMTAKRFMENKEYDNAIRIYLFMADGDQSLDGGWLGEKLGQCYEAQGDLMAAKYWYGRAVEENPEVNLDSQEARRRLASVGIDDLIGDTKST
jgi:tetratricopeptide (TPR) repeat protein